MIQALKENYVRELDFLLENVEAFSDDNLWQTPEGITNSAGILVRHLCGNLQHFIGSVLMKNGYVRNRDNEFNGPPVSKAVIVEALKELKVILIDYFEQSDPARLLETYPQEVFGYKMNVGHMLIRLYGHLTYHSGQVIYLKKTMVDGK